MGNKYTVQVWGQHFDREFYSYMQVHQGEYLIPALWALWRARRSGKWGCVILEVR